MITSGSSGIGREPGKPAAARHDAAISWSARLRGFCPSLEPFAGLLRLVPTPEVPLLSIQQQRNAGPSAERVLESH